MLLLSCQQLARGFDAEPLFQNIGFELRLGERVGLVGPNGVGKTTLMRILAGLDRPDEGEVKLHAGARVALLKQQPEYAPGQTLFAEAKSALDEVLAAQEDLVRTAEKLAQATEPSERKTLSARYDRLNEMLRHHQAYSVDHRIRAVLAGLGFAAEDYEREVNTFSGGQQSRLMLAKLLLSSPDVMLLDEPSNHLDIAATQWLENYLLEQPEAMLIVSHDRAFLDRVVNKIFELNHADLHVYPGSFKQYWRLRQERYENQLKAYTAQKEYIEKQEEYIRRVHYGQLHKQAASRQKALDKLDRVERPTLIEGPRMHFGEVRRCGDVVLHVEDLAKSYDKPLFANLNFSLPRGKRLGIMGPNGSGKSTLLRILLGQEEPDEGRVQIGHLVEFGYYDQHIRTLPDDKPVIRAVWPDNDPEVPEQRLRDLLGRFGLMGEQITQRVGELSGGERSRAALAKLVALGVNVLVLDEPTNHLDLWACDALEQALLAYEGTVIVVSHDRYFLNRVIDLLLVFDTSGKVHVVHGNYETWERMKLLQEPATSRKPDKAKEEANKTQPTSPKKEKRKRQFPYRKVTDLETDITQTEAKIQALEAQLASPELYRLADKVKEVTRDFEAAKEQLVQLYAHWEEAIELNER